MIDEDFYAKKTSQIKMYYKSSGQIYVWIDAIQHIRSTILLRPMLN